MNKPDVEPETICDSLNVPNRNEKQLDETAEVLQKLVTEDGYNADQAIMDMFAIYRIPDTPDTRKIAAEMFTLGCSVVAKQLHAHPLFGRMLR